jgi:phosphatidylinositol alpha-mannosyltransferase
MIATRTRASPPLEVTRREYTDAPSRYHGGVRIALVSPYSWTYPGGVTRHIEALATEFEKLGHEPRVLTPFDPDDALSARLHRGHRPQPRELAANVVPLGRTAGLPANGAVSNVTLTPSAVARLRRELRHGGYDVVHIHEPIVPVVSWDAVGVRGLPLVGTFHTYSTNRLTNGLGNIAGAARRFNHLHVRIAVSRAAAWTGERFFGGTYRVIPNGVTIPERALRAAAAPTPERPLRLVFVGASVERKGLPLALRAFEALREHVPATLDVIGAEAEQLAVMVLDQTGVRAHGKVSDAEKTELLARADLLVAPSLGGESFGMVLTEAFAVGTPVVASDIAGYSDVVRDGTDGVLFPRGDAQALAQRLHELAGDFGRRQAMSVAAAAHARRYAWPLVAREVLNAYADAIAAPAPASARDRAALRVGARSADLDDRRHPRQTRLKSLEADPRTSRERTLATVRRAAIVLAGAAAVAVSVLAVEKIGPGKIASALVTSQPSWVVFGLALMCAAMASRGVAWHAILRAALPGRRVRRADAMHGTFIGVLMSATLPARLGEPSRSLVVARRLGRPLETFPVVLGTIISQTLLNLLALAILGAVMFTSVNVLNGNHSALIAVALGPAALALVVLAAPLLLGRRGGLSRSARLEALRVRLAAMLTRLRAGLRVFRQPRLAAIAVGFQLGAWALQCASCYVLLIALGLDSRAGFAAAAGVLFAVNVTAVLPAAPSNIGVFQAACVAVLHGAFHVSVADAIAYGIVLQAVEVTTAVAMGIPALLREGLSWRDVRLRAMHAAPVTLKVGEPRGAATMVETR